MKIVTWNVNGYKSSYEKGDFAKIYYSNPDVICIQEVKISDEKYIKQTLPKEYSLYLNSAEKRGYSGVAIISKIPAQRVEKIIGMDRFDKEGRSIKIKAGEYEIYNFYIPHGGRKKENLPYKLESIQYITSKLSSELRRNIESKIIIAADFNIAHLDIDLARPNQNKNNTMFTKEERELLSQFIDSGFEDSLRVNNKNGELYTWWPYSFNAKERNIGWRIDYLFVTRNLIDSIKEVKVLKDFNASDHCPVLLVLE